MYIADISPRSYVYATMFAKPFLTGNVVYVKGAKSKMTITWHIASPIEMSYLHKSNAKPLVACVVIVQAVPLRLSDRH